MWTTLSFFVFNPVYLLFVMLPGLLLAMWAQAKVKSAYHKASQIAARSGRTGAQAAAEIMQASGLGDVRIEQTSGWLSDHYDPRHRVLRLSPQVYGGRSLASLGIAAHEAGHALQHAQGYAPLALRNAMVPMASVGSSLSYILVIAGLFFNMAGLMLAGIVFFGAVVLFQVVNLPCEFNASSRAREQLLSMGLITAQEDGSVSKVLNAAAMTYIAAVITSLLNLMYYVMLFLGRRD
jgi:hypothetical protein